MFPDDAAVAVAVADADADADADAVADAVDDRDKEFILMSCSLSSVNAENDDMDNDALVGVGRVIDCGRDGSPVNPNCFFCNFLTLRLINLLYRSPFISSSLNFANVIACLTVISGNRSSA